MLRVGIIGFGFMGKMHYANWSKCGNAEVVSICDVDPDIAAKSQKASGNIEGAEGAVDFDKINLYADFQEMLAAESLDIVSITLPTHTHCDFSIKALQAGVHVFCEKPMALNTEQCEQMIQAAKTNGKILQIGHCIRFWPEYAKTKHIVDSGFYGNVIAATFRRLGAAPHWGADNWFANDKTSGGLGLDLHVHDSDFIQYLFGMPKSVQSFGNPKSGDGLKHITTRYSYDDDKLVTAEGSWAMSTSFGFEMSFNIVMEKATIVYDSTRQPAFKVCPASGEPFTPEVEAGDGYLLQKRYLASLVEGNSAPETITPQSAADSIRLVRCEIESLKHNREVML